MTATTPTTMSTKLMTVLSTQFRTGLSYRKPQENVTIIAYVPHPVVKVTCGRVPIFMAERTKIPRILEDGNEGETLMSMEDFVAVQEDRDGSNGTMIDAIPPTWLPLPEANSSSFIGVFAPFSLENTNHTNQSYTYPVSSMFTHQYWKDTQLCLNIYTCSISAFWETSANAITPSDGISITQISDFEDTDLNKAKSKTPITMDLATISSFNGSEVTQFFESAIPRTAVGHRASYCYCQCCRLVRDLQSPKASKVTRGQSQKPSYIQD
jgi:hypothetical protein